MMMHRFLDRPAIRSLAIMFAGCFFANADDCRAGIVFLAPTPYLSAADSPFPVDGSNPDFFLEDFEDGELNTPGIRDEYAALNQTLVLGPGPVTDSVDADDGIIDGYGTNGHSLASTFFVVFPTTPPAYHRRFRFSFEKENGIELPKAFGFVWTDGAEDSTILLQVFDNSQELIGETRFHGIGDASSTGTTDEDVFIGVISPHSIGHVDITSIAIGTNPTVEIDHIQYGALVPEPDSLCLVSVALIVVSAMRCRLLPQGID